MSNILAKSTGYSDSGRKLFSKIPIHFVDKNDAYHVEQWLFVVDMVLRDLTPKLDKAEWARVAS